MTTTRTAAPAASATPHSPYAHTVATACAGWGAAPVRSVGWPTASAWGRVRQVWQAWRQNARLRARLAQEDRALHALSAATRRDLGLAETRLDPKANDHTGW
jgi:hypothetical protein